MGMIMTSFKYYTEGKLDKISTLIIIVLSAFVFAIKPKWLKIATVGAAFIFMFFDYFYTNQSEWHETGLALLTISIMFVGFYFVFKAFFHKS